MLSYSKGYFLGGEDYEGPYGPDGENYDGVVVDGNEITIKMAKPFPDMDYWGAFAAIGPVPSGTAGQPPNYGLHPMATGPYKVKSFTPNQELVLESQHDLGRGHRPGSPPVRRRVDLEVRPGPRDARTRL